ncbi:hypothetical protein [Sphingobacterium sp.]|uniref:hypothetical protein n=1 Tax=Sphingobacterium sp. TaxID=341027 RepID=UPI0028A9D8FF|nr:hypothetical protein [Sphingobacterium sp.]
MMAVKYIDLKHTMLTLFLMILFLNGILIYNQANAQEKQIQFKKYEFRDKLVPKLFIQGLQISKKIEKNEYIVVNYNRSKKQLKIAIMDRYEFSKNMFLFKDIVVGVSKFNCKTFGFLGDSEEFLQSTNKFIKVDYYKNYYKQIEKSRLRKAKEQGLIYFPTNIDPYSLFYRFDNGTLTYLDANMISVFNNEWM